MSAVRYWTVFSLGVIAGAGAALIYAPQTGAKTRKQLKRNLADTGDYLRDASGDLGERAKGAVKKSKGVIEDFSARVGSAASAASDKASETIKNYS